MRPPKQHERVHRPIHWLVVDLQPYAVCFFRRNHPKTIKMRFMAVSVACIFAIPFLYLMGSFDEVGRTFLFPAMTH